MSNIKTVLKEFLIIADQLPKDNRFLWKDTNYGQLESCLRDDENWHSLFNAEFDRDKLKDTFSSLSEEEKEQIFKFGVVCLIQFVHCNFTGPGIENQTAEYLNHEKFNSFPFAAHLAVNNEDININTEYPVLLFTSKIIFELCVLRNNVINNWWHWRSLIIQQQILDEPSPILLSEAENVHKVLQENSILTGDLKALLDIEIAQLFLLYRHISKVKEHLSSATEVLGICCDQIGLMGKRTKFQERDLAQLTVKVNVQPKDPTIERLEVHNDDGPKDIPLNDDVLLNEITFTGEVDDNVMVTNLEQKLLLTMIQEILVAKPQDELQSEEILPLIRFILSQKNTFCVRTVALLLRCKFESKNKRTIERSLMQCEEIINSWKRKVPHCLERVLDVFGTGLQPIWKIEAQHADMLLNIGLVKNALDIYLKIKLWEEVIVCYTILQLRHKAAEVIKEQLDKKPTVKLWCLLGDATDDITCYETAWELSKRRSHRAQRHWGQYFYVRKQYAECIPHFEKSIGINPLQSVVWSRLGFAALQVEQWQLAATAYRRYTSLEPDSFEAWNNLAQAYIKIKNSRSAHQAIHEALKCNYGNWKVWENLLVVSCDIANVSDVIRAYHMLLDLRQKYLNKDVLNILVYNVCNDRSDCDGKSSKRFLEKTKELVGRISGIFPAEGFVWELYANLASDLSLRVQRLQKAHRCYIRGDWAKKETSCQQVLYVCIKLAETVLEDEVSHQDALLNSVKLSVQSALTTVKKQDFPELKELVDKVDAIYSNISKKINCNETDKKDGS